MTRVTKRKYAHEMYPHAEEFETRPLAVEVPYLYSRAIGYAIEGTGWFKNPGREANDRIVHLQEVARVALLADAALQGLTGDEAWSFADQGVWDYGHELVWQRAIHYGVKPDQIKPYPCVVEPDEHSHYGEPDSRGWRTVHRIDGKESECDECTEPAPTGTGEPS